LFEVGLYFVRSNAEIKFSFIDKKFIELFCGKVESSDFPEDCGFNYKPIYSRKLLLANPLQTIFRKLGSGDAILKIRNVYRLLQCYRKGDGWGSLVDGEKNYFFAIDVNNELQLICIWWNNGWGIKVVSNFEDNKKVLPPGKFFSFRS